MPIHLKKLKPIKRKLRYRQSKIWEYFDTMIHKGSKRLGQKSSGISKVQT